MFDKFPTSRDSNELLKDIRNTLKEYTSKNYVSGDIEFGKALQANYQIVRGGIVNGLRNWNGLTTASPSTKNYVSKSIKPPKDLIFWGLLDHAYLNMRYNPFIDSDNRYVANIIKNIPADSLLDKEINQQATQIADLTAAASAAAAISDNLNIIGDEFKKLEFKKDFKYDKKKNGGTSLSDFGVTGNIYVNLKYLYLLSKNQTSLASDPSGKNVISLGKYFDSLCHDIQISLGNVNDFKIHIDPVDGIARIIDLNYINKNQVNDLFKFKIGTNDSIVRDLKLESYVSNDMMSMISISAQAAPGKMGYDNTTVVSYNQGISDRNIPNKDIPQRFDNDEGRVFLNFISNLGMLVNTYLKDLFENETITYENIQTTTGGLAQLGSGAKVSSSKKSPYYNANQSNSYSNALREIINYISSVRVTDNSNKKILPTEISLTLDGLAGFIIGNLFEVDNTFIPKYYKGASKMGYTITGVSHELSNGDWTTTIKAFPVDLDSNKVATNPIGKFDTVYVIPNNGENGPGGGGNGGSGFGTSSKDCGDATEDIIPLLRQNGITFASDIDSRVTPQFYKDLQNQIIPFLKTQLQKFTVVSVNRPGSLDHGGGNGIDIQIIDINSSKISSQWKKTNYSGWDAFKIDHGKNINISSANKTHPFSQNQLTDINEVSNNMVGGFSGTPMASNPYWYTLNIGGGTYKFLNEHFNPSDPATGPHFHIGRVCLSSNNNIPAPQPKPLPVKKPIPPQPKTNTPVETSSVKPPNSTPSTNTPIQPSPTPSNTPKAPQPSQQPYPLPTPTPPIPSPTIMEAPKPKTTWRFPYIVSVAYTADGTKTNIIDEMHAFQSTQGKTVGNGNIIVGDVLKKMYRDGIKPIVTGVSVVVEHKENSAGLHWYVTIEESKDGLAYTGFTSRGSGSGGGTPSASQARSDGKDEISIKNNINKQLGYMPKDFKQVGPDVTHSDSSYKRYFRQVFYVYTDQNP
jgi:hypothetical protein